MSTKPIKAYISDERETKKERKKISNKQWFVYYYLLSISKWNSKDKEEHRYVYKKDINIAKVSKNLGIARSTFYDSIESLVKSKIIKEIKQVDETYYKLPIYSNCYANIQPYVLSTLIQYSSSKVLGIELLRTYLILKKYDSLRTNKLKYFTKTDLFEILGKDRKASCEYKKMDLILSFLQKTKLISLKVEQKSNGFANYYLYTLTKTNNESAYLKDKYNFNERGIPSDMIQSDIMEFLKEDMI